MEWYQRRLKPTYGAHFQLFPSWLLRTSPGSPKSPFVSWCHQDTGAIWVWCYPLVNVYIAMENHHAINGKIHYFNGHFQLLFVCSPEGSGRVDCATPEMWSDFGNLRRNVPAEPEVQSHWSLQELLTMETGQACFLSGSRPFRLRRPGARFT